MPSAYLFMVDRKLRPFELNAYQFRAPICQVCGNRLIRVATRERGDPANWTPCGWLCEPCSLITMFA